MKTRIQKSRTGLVLHIPKACADAAALESGMEMDITVTDDRLIVTRPAAKLVTLEELVAGITDENIHPEVDWGKPVGKEVW